MQKLLILVKLMNRIKAAAEIKGGEIYEIKRVIKLIMVIRVMSRIVVVK